MRLWAVGSEEPNTHHTRRLPVRSHEDSPNRPRLAVRLNGAWFSRLAEVLDPEISFERLPFCCGVAQRPKEPRLEPANGMRWTKQIPMQLHRIDLRLVRIRKEHGRFYRRPVSLLVRECLTPGFSRGGIECLHHPPSAASRG